MDAAQKPATTAAPPPLICDADHLYWLTEPPRTPENLPGVTEVMTELGFESDEYFTKTHSTRGTAVHAEMANAARGVPEFPFLDPDLVGWVRSGRLWLAETAAAGAVVRGAEVMRHHPLYRFAGTIDLHLANWRGYEWVLDYKTGKAPKIARFKLAAYDLLLGPTPDGKPRKKAAVELDRDGGRAKLVEYNTPEHYHDGSRFLSYLTTLRDRRIFAPKAA